ncbi:C4-methyl sterol oxidase [Mycena maculata]|uniref:C4-methyl sterol oxidase n=1 Tax=Mycena maculata TaxID=230809 RepID=A0AAD7MW16_9AGAR|nr:C4-methyl sterol oxidase [Mycena maculata]
MPTNATSIPSLYYASTDLTSLSWLEQHWVASYVYIGNPIIATSLMSFSLHEIPSAQDQWYCIKQVLFLHFIIGLLRLRPITANISVCFFHPTAEMFGMRTYELPLPSLREMALQVAFFFVYEHTFHHFADRADHHAIQRALHYRPLYRHIHKIHHKYAAPFGLAPEYAHPLEVAVLGTGVMTGPLLYCYFTSNLHILAFYVWMTFRLFQAIDAHSDFPWSLQHIIPFGGGAEHHDFHHMAFMNSFGASFRWWDRIFGTDDKYRERIEMERKFMAEVEAEGMRSP